MIGKILVGTAASQQAYAGHLAAAELATSYDAELFVLEVEPHLDARSVFDPDGVPARDDHLIPLRANYPQLQVRFQRARGDAMRAVCQLAERERFDLIVIPLTRSRSDTMMSRRALRTLIRQAPCPVMLMAS